MTRRNLAVVPDQGIDEEEGVEYFAEGELDEAGLPPDEWGNFTPNGRPRCKGIKPNGLRCGSFRNEATGFCHGHDPQVTHEQRSKMASKGGLHSSKAYKDADRMIPARLRKVFGRLEAAMDAIVDGTMAPGRATALASLASASVRVLEAGEMEERMRRMEKAAGMSDDLDEGGDGEAGDLLPDEGGGE